jgi:uncharacterized protein (TIGR03435 family)
VATLIQFAYGVFADGVNPATGLGMQGGPSWLTSELYDLNAKAGGSTPLPQMAGPMLQMLLEDRCKLKIHKGTGEAPVYFLTVLRKQPPGIR